MTEKVVKAYTLTIITLPITTQYKSFIPGISMGELFVLIIIPFIRLNFDDSKVSLNKILSNPFLWYVFYLIIGSLISITTQSHFSLFEIITRLIRYTFYIFCAVVLSRRFFNLQYCMQWYGRISIFATLYLMLQLFLFYTNGTLLRGTIPWLDVTNEYYSFEGQKSLLLDFYRPHSIFLEPGYYVIFILPFLAYSLFNKHTSNLKLSIFLTIGLVLSTSGQGLILSVVIWSIWIIRQTLNKKRKVKIQIIPIFFLFVVITPFILQNDTIQRSIDRLWGGPTASSTSRIFDGFNIYGELPILYKVIGVGFGNEAFLINNQLISSGSQGVLSYMNSLAYILVNLGIIGFLLLIGIFIFMFIKARGFQRICLFILVILSAVGTIFVSSTIILYISIIMSKYIIHYNERIRKQKRIAV
jgi:hypothetical protein